MSGIESTVVANALDHENTGMHASVHGRSDGIMNRMGTKGFKKTLPILLEMEP